MNIAYKGSFLLPTVIASITVYNKFSFPFVPMSMLDGPSLEFVFCGILKKIESWFKLPFSDSKYQCFFNADTTYDVKHVLVP